jgi:putative ABC transport system permease protein
MSAATDLRDAARRLTRTPGYATVTILTLALGIGSTAAAFAVIGSVLLRPLPFSDSEQLVAIYSATGKGTFTIPSYPDFEDLAAQQDVFAGVAFITGDGVTYRGPQESKFVLAAMTTADFFPLLRARPVLGRLLTRADDRAGAAHVAVLTNRTWHDDFGSDPSVVGKTMDLSIGDFTIVGVLDAGQAYPEWVPGTHADVYISLAAAPYMLHGAMSNRDSRSDSRTIARLAPGMTRERAESRLQLVAGHIAAAYPASDSGLRFALRPLREQVVGNIGPALAVLGIAVTLILLIACADAANLALVRATTREHEIAVRTVLGAGRARLVHALLSESVLLATTGGVLGTLLAAGAVRLFVDASPANIPRLDEIHVDRTALAAATAATILAVFICTVTPFLANKRTEVASALKAGGRGAGAARRGLRVRSAIVTGQMALSVMLITDAGLLIRSFAVLRGVSPGYDPHHLITWMFRWPESRVDTQESRLALIRRVAAAMRVPGVESVAFTKYLPLDQGGAFTPVGPDGRDTAADSVGALYQIVGPGYFATMGQRIVRGREFTEADLTSADVPSIVSVTAARRFWPHADPIGREMTVLNSVHYRNADFGKPIRTTVVGVAADVKQFALDEDPYPAVYLPITHPVPAGAWAVARTSIRPEAVLNTMRRAVAQIDPDLPVTHLAIEDNRIASSLARQRFIMSLLTIFSGIALALAALGLYGVMAYAVGQRVPELGIRMALGAGRARIVWLVLRATATIVALGLIVGIAGALLLGGTIRSLLYGVAPSDPATIGAVAGVLTLVAAVASYLPARRAARLDPAVALRAE